MTGSIAAPVYSSVPRVEYAGFWLRLLAYLIDSAVIGIGFVVIVIPLIFLTGIGDLLSRFHPDEDMNDVGLFFIFGVLFLAATASLVLTWLYHALMESSEWQATLGKKFLGLAVTDMAGQRVSFGRATGRHFAKIITNMVPLLIGYLMAAFTQKRQALHDMIAGCLVLRRG
ncbi:MAG TPA: RDD family protein [Candidatus Acidoferrum sp.]|nr:RDD family protein [Candidatus Acidoferrum sp.]